VDCPVLVLARPFKTVLHVDGGEEGLSTRNTGAETDITKCTANGFDGGGLSRLLLPQNLDLAGGESAVCILFDKALERFLRLGVEDLAFARMFARARRPGGLEAAEGITNCGSSTPKMGGDLFQGLSSFTRVNDVGTLGGGKVFWHILFF
jgi:hypothetical protein